MMDLDRFSLAAGAMPTMTWLDRTSEGGQALAKELAEFVPLFLKGAYIVYAHSVLQRQCGLGYTSEWAKKNFKSIGEKKRVLQEGW